MSAPITRTYTDLFTIARHPYYITLYFLGEFIGNFDNDSEIKEAKRVEGIKIDSVRNVYKRANEFADGSGLDYKGTREFGEYFLNVDGEIISVFTVERV